MGGWLYTDKYRLLCGVKPETLSIPELKLGCVVLLDCFDSCQQITNVERRRIMHSKALLTDKTDLTHARYDSR